MKNILIDENLFLGDTDMWIGPICQTRTRLIKSCSFRKSFFFSLSHSLAVRIFWSFDNTLQDLYNNFNGVGTNNPTYLSPGYNGAGTCIWLNKTLNQSVTILSPPFLNMAYTSFTLQAWMNANTLCNGTGCTDNAPFGQFQQNILDHSLHIIVRRQNIYLGFFSDDAVGNMVSESKPIHRLNYYRKSLSSRHSIPANGIIWYVLRYSSEKLLLIKLFF